MWKRAAVQTLRTRSIGAARACRVRVFSTQASDTAETHTNSSSEGQTHFGYSNVDTNAKKPMVAEVFHRVAAKYDLMNDFMSAGIHRVWKHEFIAMLNPQPGMRHLDVAGGTGDIASGVIEVIRHNGGSKASALESAVTVCDINASMLEVGEERARQRGYMPAAGGATVGGVELNFIEGDAEKLPFESNTFDAYTIAFGLRNVTHIDKALAEAHRVLKPGGRFLCLEFSQLDNVILQQIYDTYSFNVIPALGEVVAGDRDSYQYLVESIRKFPPQHELVQKMADAGLRCNRFTNLTNGVVAVHSGFKL